MESPKSQFSGSQPHRREWTMTGATTMTEPQAKPSESTGPLVPTGFEHINQILPAVIEGLFAKAKQQETDCPSRSDDRGYRWAA